MAKAIVLFVVLSQAVFSLIGYVMYSKMKSARMEIKRNTLLIKLKDYLLAPTIAVLYSAYCFTESNPFWLSMNSSLLVKIVGLLVVIFAFALKLAAHVQLGYNWSRVIIIYENHVLVKKGPYRWMRHPIYASYLFATVGVFLVTGSLVLCVLLFAYFFLNALRANEEEKYLLSKFGSDYAKYMSEVGKFIPFFP